ncbi:MAG: hypothetical protein LBP71_03360 [Spirochaetaceae bacterium]|jgi:hypothetical protein|nr:hypothetical protein [Spirochaetaceae bacterium]
MYKKSLFLGAAALALLVLLAFVGCSNPSSGDTQYVAQAASEYPFPEDTVFVSDRAALDGLLNEYTAETNKVQHIAYSGTIATQLEIPSGKIVYLNPSETVSGSAVVPAALAANIVVNEGAKLVLVSQFETSTGAPPAAGKILVHGTVEVFKFLGVGNSALDVADYTVENGLIIGRNTVIGQKVTILPGATLSLKPSDIIPPDQNSGNKFTPAQAWIAAGQGHLVIDGALTNYDYEVKDLLKGVYPSASRKYYVESSRIRSETLPALIPLGAYITTSATPDDCDGNVLTVNGSLATNGTLKNITEIIVGNGGDLNLQQASGDILDKLTKLTVGPGASFNVATPNVTLQSLETLFLGDGSRFEVDEGNSVTFIQAEDKKLFTTMGKKVYYLVGTAADAIVDVKITDDASLISGSKLVVNPGSTFTLDAEKTLTVESGATVDFSALTPPATTADPSPVIIDGTIVIDAGGTLIGPALVDFEATPEALFETIKLVDEGKVVLDWGAAYVMGTGVNEKPYIGPSSDSPTYQWTGSTPGDGAQIEINAAGLIIRDTNAGGAAVEIANTRSVILKGQSLTLDTGVTLTITNGNTLWLVGGSETDGDGAILKGAGKVVIGGNTEIVGGPYGWQVVGDSIGIYSHNGGTEAVLMSGSSSSSVTTPAATLKALGSVLGASITQKAASGNNLTIRANTTIALGGAPQKKVGEIVLAGGSDPGKISFVNETSKITTGNSSTTTTTAGSLADNGATAVTGNTIDSIGIDNLVGNRTPGGAALGSTDPATKVTTTAVVNTTDNDLMAEGKLASLSGRDATYGGTVTGGATTNDAGYINSETSTNADTTT